MRRFSLLWFLLLLVTLVSAGFVVQRLSDVPQLPVTIGPDMRVRAVKVQHIPPGSVLALKRDDRIMALNGRSTEDLRELRHTLLHTEEPGEGVEAPSTDGANASIKPLVGPVVNYQLVRPLHRFDLLLQGEPLEPSALPPGVHEGDKLVELDGRQMKPKVGTEGLRSIISSRPEALLVLERRDAVFDGELSLGVPVMPWGVAACFLMALLTTLGLWRFPHESISRWTQVATAGETIAFAWWSLLVFQYQWVIADYALAYCAIGGLVLTRPLGIFARTASAEDGGPNKWGALALGVVGAAFVIGALAMNKLPNAEVALQFAAVLAGLFVIFEILLTGLNEGSGTLLGERSVYLAGILLFVLFACVVSYSIDPIAFGEERWRWFSAIVLALVWFGDILLCFRGLPLTPFAEISTRQARREKVANFLDEIAMMYPQVRPALAVSHEEQVYLVEHPEGVGLTIELADEALSDAVAILLQERARVPAPLDVAEQTDPLAGIARTMGIGLALELSQPHHGLSVEAANVVLIGYAKEGLPPVDVEALDYAQHRMTAGVWGATMLELMIESLSHRVAPPAEVVEEEEELTEEELEAREEIEILEEELDEARKAFDELEQESAMLREDRRDLATRVASMSRWFQPAPALPMAFDSLLEHALLDALATLAEEPHAIALTGPRGAGKTFICSAGHLLEGRAPAPCILYDAALFDPEEHPSNLLGYPVGDEDVASEAIVFEACAAGSLIIQRAEWLPPEIFSELLARALEHDVRLYLCFDVEEGMGGSPIQAMGEDAPKELEYRELVIPPLTQRAAVQEAIIRHWLDEASYMTQREILDVSPAALKALMGYHWPGQITELALALELAVKHSKGDFIELGDLPLDVRRGTF